MGPIRQIVDDRDPRHVGTQRALEERPEPIVVYYEALNPANLFQRGDAQGGIGTFVVAKKRDMRGSDRSRRQIDDQVSALLSAHTQTLRKRARQQYRFRPSNSQRVSKDEGTHHVTRTNDG